MYPLSGVVMRSGRTSSPVVSVVFVQFRDLAARAVLLGATPRGSLRRMPSSGRRSWGWVFVSTSHNHGNRGGNERHPFDESNELFVL